MFRPYLSRKNIWKSIDDYKNKSKKVLFFRGIGGLGDVLMHRMMFYDIHKNLPGIEIHFAVPKEYIPAAVDHPYIDKVVDFNTVNTEDYLCWYNTTSACGRYECYRAPLADKHRSDIWANHCGLYLTEHKGYFQFSKEEKLFAQEFYKKRNNCCLFCPISAQDTKNLNDRQIDETIQEIRECGAEPVVVLSKPPECKMNCELVTGLTIRQWMSIVSQAPWVVSVDTAMFHMAGMAGRALTGIFTWADGKVYGKYYDFTLIQKHRDNGDWDCGPCYIHPHCTKLPPGASKYGRKPCLDLIDRDMLSQGIRTMFYKKPVSSQSPMYPLRISLPCRNEFVGQS